jgi:hypothetical protein
VKILKDLKNYFQKCLLGQKNKFKIFFKNYIWYFPKKLWRERAHTKNFIDGRGYLKSPTPTLPPQLVHGSVQLRFRTSAVAGGGGFWRMTKIDSRGEGGSKMFPKYNTYYINGKKCRFNFSPNSYTANQFAMTTLRHWPWKPVAAGTWYAWLPRRPSTWQLNIWARVHSKRLRNKLKIKELRVK